VLGLENKGADCRTRDNKVGEEASRRHIFLSFLPFQVPSEPRQGFWDAAEPLEQSVFLFEHCKTCFKHFEQFNIRDPFGGWTRRCSPEWGELLYQVVVFMSDVQ
jgi:hypothetical protein